MAFGKRLNKDQVRIKHFGITISGEDKLQFYLKQMSALNHFDKKEMTEWENKTITIKDDFDKAKTYFEGLVKDYKVYAQNSGSTAGKLCKSSGQSPSRQQTVPVHRWDCTGSGCPGRTSRQHPWQHKGIVQCNGRSNQGHVGPDRATHQNDGQQRELNKRPRRRRRRWRQRRRPA